MSNAKSRLRLIEPVRMFDEQRVNIAGTVSAFAGIVSIEARSFVHKDVYIERRVRERERERIREANQGREGKASARWLA